MEINSSGEETVIKVRKPYTITKQRERWTEAEHKRFLEALKLYGRQWQRIEEVGAVAIVLMGTNGAGVTRKLQLEKEAMNNGTSPGKAHDIDIPPPRPKRKPNSPYPRKNGLNSETSTKEVLNDKLTKSNMRLSNGNVDMTSVSLQKLQRKEISEKGSCSEVLTLFRDVPSASFSSVNKSSSNHGAPSGTELTKIKIRDMTTMGKSCLSIDVHENAKEINGHEMEKLNGIHISSKSDHTHEDYLDTSTDQMKLKPMSVETAYMDRQTARVSHSVTEKNGATSIAVTETDGSHPDQTSDQEGANGRMNPCIHPTVSIDPKLNINATPLTCPHNYASLSPMMQCNCNQDVYKSFLNMSSTFSNMLVSTLLSNPAIHAAARVAASYWPAVESNTSVDPTQENPAEGIQGSNIGSPPSMASMVAATVAAASAWWATQECQEARNQDQSEALRVAGLKESDGSRKADLSLHNELKISPVQNADTTPTTVDDTSDPFKNKKKQDRSSCGSNTPSSSDVEANNVPEKQDKGNDNAKQASCSNSSAGDNNHRRFRSSGSTSDSWKEVSEEGRLAFDALFSREKLPQSFSPPQAEESKEVSKEEDEVTTVTVDLNKKATAIDHDLDTMDESRASSPNELSQLKLKSRRTGFKPYKRCSMEAKDDRVPANDDVGTKRIRLESEAST
ncbi:hypothetical protein PR202_gb28754 [Eleusine coracana subsp. coracana]|uniref:HTH myb-type domain-containing protein n=1 Tax=Eleusine coracana subsp. coracana TaxID=191504 RepID=A0AAV5FXU4_ELECO|nr:hypothetical protein PR202_gb28754 [Eleusine coracana subsp. coracana]